MSSAEPFPLLWSRPCGTGSTGLSLARERGWLLVWETPESLVLFDRGGQVLAQRVLPQVLAAACAEDGSSCVAITGTRELHWLAPDLSTRKLERLPAEPGAVAVDAFGTCAAVSTRTGQLLLYLREGGKPVTVATPVPLRHLSFCVTAPLLVGAAEYGLVIGVDRRGEARWRDGLVATIGGLAVSGDGQQILCACFSEGVKRYDALGKSYDGWSLAEPCSLVAQSFDGQRILVADRKHQVLLLTPAGTIQARLKFDKPLTALALGPLGRDFYAIFAQGAVQRYLIRTEAQASSDYQL